jgi:hypothetical protein
MRNTYLNVNCGRFRTDLAHDKKRAVSFLDMAAKQRVRGNEGKSSGS